MTFRRDSCVEFLYCFPWLARQIPYSSEQGFFETEQGMSRADQGTRGASAASWANLPGDADAVSSAMEDGRHSGSVPNRAAISTDTCRDG
jgi:hypothetical protein